MAETLSNDVLLIEKSDGIATVTLNRPQKHNALSGELRSRLVAAVGELAADESVRVVIFTGAGEKAFCAGVDLKEIETAPPSQLGAAAPINFNEVFSALHKPTIAAINGFCVTGGLEIALNCDILVGSTNAKFADNHARFGLVPMWGVTQLLPMYIGPVRAKYLSFTGNFLDAATAKQWGLLLKVVEPQELLPFCLKLAKEIASCPVAALTDIHRLINHGLYSTVEEGLQLEVKTSMEATKRMFGAQK